MRRCTLSSHTTIMKSLAIVLSFISSVYATTNVCGQGANKLLVPLLKNYQPAQKFCTSRYSIPVSTQTVTAAAIPITTTDIVSATTTVVVTTTVVAQGIRRANTTPAINPPQPAQDHGRGLEELNIDAQWSSYLKEAKQVVQTLCSCIETPRTSTVSLSLRRFYPLPARFLTCLTRSPQHQRLSSQ